MFPNGTQLVSSTSKNLHHAFSEIKKKKPYALLLFFTLTVLSQKQPLPPLNPLNPLNPVLCLQVMTVTPAHPQSSPRPSLTCPVSSVASYWSCVCRLEASSPCASSNPKSRAAMTPCEFVHIGVREERI